MRFKKIIQNEEKKKKKNRGKNTLFVVFQSLKFKFVFDLSFA